jgi:hypothetical protein
MILYSEILLRLKDKLSALDLDQVPSYYLQQNGIDEVYQDEQVNDALLTKILQLEINGRSLLKLRMLQEEERSKISIEENRHELLQIKIDQELEKTFPQSRMIDSYKTLYPGFIARTSTLLKELVTIDNDHNIVTKSGVTDNKHPENMNALDRLLHDARVSPFNRNESVQDLIYKIVEKEGSIHFFKHE